MRRRLFFLATLLVAALAACHAADQAPDAATFMPNSDGGPYIAPGELIDLTHFILTIPTKADGTEGGFPAATVRADVLSPPGHSEQGYASKYFYIDQDTHGAGVTFYCPSTGARTSETSHFPRTELRHQIVSNTNDGWPVGGPISPEMSAYLSVRRLPPGPGAIIIGQIHGRPGQDETESAPLLLIMYTYDAILQSGDVTVRVKGSPDRAPIPPDHVFTLATDVRLGDLIHYDIAVKSDILTVNGVDTIISAWIGESVYFKAGAYLQTTGTRPDIGALVTFYRIEMKPW